MVVDKVVLAYSGGLDTSVILHWLKATCPTFSRYEDWPVVRSGIYDAR